MSTGLKSSFSHFSTDKLEEWKQSTNTQKTSIMVPIKSWSTIFWLFRHHSTININQPWPLVRVSWLLEPSWPRPWNICRISMAFSNLFVVPSHHFKEKHAVKHKNTQNSFQMIWCFQVVFLQHAVFCFPKKTKAIGLAPNSSAKDHPNSLPYLHQNHGFPWWFWCNKNKQNHSRLAKTRLQIHTETTKTAYNIHKFGDSMCFPTLELFELLTFPPKKI